MTAHKTWQGGVLLFQHRWDWIDIYLPHFFEYSAKKIFIPMNPILFHYTLETNCYPVNNLISRNGIWKNERANANSILDKEMKKDVQQRVYLMHPVHSGSGTVQQ